MKTKLAIPALLVLAALVVGCLEGDPNAVGQGGVFTGGSSGTSGGSSSGIPVVQADACSGSSTKAVTLTFRNQTDRTLGVFWVNQQCVEVAYGSVQPGQSHVQPTFITHAWRVRDSATNALYKEFVATNGGDTEVVVP